MIFSSKKGIVQDTLGIMIFFFIFALVIIISSGAFSTIKDGVVGQWDNAQADAIITHNESKFSDVWDKGFLFLLIGSVIAGVIGLFIVDSHPLLFIAALIFIGTLLLLAGIFANSYSDLTATSTLSTWEDDFVFIPLIMNHFMETIAVIIGIFSVALYAKFRIG